MERKLILFQNENIHFELRNKTKIRHWIKNTIQKERRNLLELNFIFCDDAYLHKINMQYLKHDTYTDIITFDNSFAPNDISGDVFISIERVKENSKKYKEKFEKELHRVVIHGVLHLIGYDDKSSAQVKVMRQKEDYYLSLAPHID